MKSVKDVLEEVANGGGRFSKKAFGQLLTAMAGDPDFTAEVAIIKKGEFTGYEEIAIGEEFRKWVRKVVEKAGLDSADSELVMKSDFNLGDISWMYDFFAEAMWLYMSNGGKFELHKKENFDGGSLKVVDVEKSQKRKDVKRPGSSEVLGTFDITEEGYKKLVSSSGCPKYLRSRIRVE